MTVDIKRIQSAGAFGSWIFSAGTLRPRVLNARRRAATIAAVAALGVVMLAPPTTFAQNADSDLGKFSASGSGIVVPARSWDISAEVPNQIKRIFFKEGQFVKKGDLLVKFDTSFKKLDVELAELTLARARTKLALAKDRFDRKKKLGNVATEVELRESSLNLEVAQADLREAEILLSKAKTILEVQEIYAPFDGQVSAPLYRDNANVDPARDTEIATLVQLDPINVRVEAKYRRVQIRVEDGETDAEVLKQLTLTLELPDGTTYPHQGRLLTAPYKFDPETGTGTVMAQFPNPNLLLRPGLKVKVTSYERSKQ
jgi:RND family efflux transporter MFP subunit